MGEPSAAARSVGCVLLRRITAEVVGAAFDVTFSSWGEPVTIDPPPPGQVEPLPMPSDEA